MSIYTIGYGNTPLNSIIETVKIYHIDYIVDVRSSPYSKYNKEFNKEYLSAYLKNQHIGYKYMGDKIGGKPSSLELRNNQGEPDYSLIEKTEEYKNGISELIEFAKNKNIVLMCAELDPLQCHRHNLIAQTLLSKNIIVYHILKDHTLLKAPVNIKQISFL